MSGSAGPGVPSPAAVAAAPECWPSGSLVIPPRLYGPQPRIAAGQSVSLAASTIQPMDNVVDLIGWRRARKAPTPAPAPADRSIGRLDRAVRRLDPLASEILDR